MLRALAILLLAASPALAQEPCRADACSDDRAGVLGNEVVSWDPIASWGGTPGTYQIWSDEIPDGPCLEVAPDLTSISIAGTRCYGRLRMKACNQEGLCSLGWSDEVEVLPYSCLNCGEPECGVPGSGGGWCTCTDAYEYPCWESAPLRLPHLPTGPPPVLEPELALAPRAWGSYGGEVAPGPPRWASWAAVGAIALDYWTTRQALDRGAREASPLGPEGGVVLRLGIVWAADRWAARRPGTAVALTIAGASLAAAIHNHGVNR